MSSAQIVAVDLRRNTAAPQYGISRYARNLVHAARSMAPRDLEVRPVDLAGSANWGTERPFLTRGGADWRSRVVQEQIDLRRLSKETDLLHLPWFEGPFAPRLRHVVSVHDLDTVDHPASYGWRFRAYYNTLLRAYVRTAAALIVPSQATADAVQRHWPRAVRRCSVVPLGVDPVFRPDGPAEQAWPERRLVLYTGGFGARKRLGDLISAFEVVARRIDDVVLVMTGSAPPALREQSSRSPVGGRIHFTGPCDDARLAGLYRRATVVAYPSSMEGFGFPIVEGFASGTPVVTTAAGSVLEIAQDAAITLAVGDVASLAEAVQSVIENREGVNDRLTAAGLRRAKQYTWNATAARTLDVYRAALS